MWCDLETNGVPERRSVCYSSLKRATHSWVAVVLLMGFSSEQRSDGALVGIWAGACFLMTGCLTGFCNMFPGGGLGLARCNLTPCRNICLTALTRCRRRGCFEGHRLALCQDSSVTMVDTFVGRRSVTAGGVIKLRRARRIMSNDRYGRTSSGCQS
jgi:hypothetical protein